MKEKDNSPEKDIVQRIVEQLKAADELPYAEGAWERFRDDYLPTAKPARVLPLWLSTAAACAVLFMVGLWHFQAGNNDTIEPNLISQTQVAPSKPETIPVPVEEVPESIQLLPTYKNPQSYQIHTAEALAQVGRSRIASVDVVTSWGATPSMQNMLMVGDIDNNLVRHPKKISFSDDEEDVVLREGGMLPSVFADSKGVQTVAMKEVVGESKRFRFSDKFNIGVVVAPSSTDQKVNFGGGLMLAYNVTKQLSVRTGATFHQYEVGALRNPGQAMTMEVAAAPERPLQADLSQFSSNMAARMPLIPNVNSISGMVRTVDIPVEAKYSFYKGLYAGVGVSYAAVLDQQRFAHYIENVNANPYAAGLPSNESELRAAVQPVVQTLESANTNVNSSGFGGFVNMSVGKELKIKRGPSVSLEPYVKFPVGNFKRADMNYTNGGIRVITNF